MHVFSVLWPPTKTMEFLLLRLPSHFSSSYSSSALFSRKNFAECLLREMEGGGERKKRKEKRRFGNCNSLSPQRRGGEIWENETLWGGQKIDWKKNKIRLNPDGKPRDRTMETKIFSFFVFFGMCNLRIIWWLLVFSVVALDFFREKGGKETIIVLNRFQTNFWRVFFRYGIITRTWDRFRKKRTGTRCSHVWNADCRLARREHGQER